MADGTRTNQNRLKTYNEFSGKVDLFRRKHGIRIREDVNPHRQMALINDEM